MDKLTKAKIKGTCITSALFLGVYGLSELQDRVKNKVVKGAIIATKYTLSTGAMLFGGATGLLFFTGDKYLEKE